MNGKLQNGNNVSWHRAAALLALLCAIVALAWPAPAHADTIYAYSGAAYTSCSGAYAAPCSGYSLSGAITLALPIASLANLTNFSVPSADIISFSFTDGLVTLNQSNTTYNVLMVTTDSLSQITGWGLGLTDVPLSPGLGPGTLLSSAGMNGVASFELSNHYPNDTTIDTPLSIVVPPPDYSAFNRGGEYNPWSAPVDPPTSTPETGTLSLCAAGIAALSVFGIGARRHRPSMERCQ